ncbi:MAG: SPOR domain-containing protein [Gammaproteobacteria bacterium]|nr:SPOR domain-containing protein [Gammaproteobacteria bacterium]
MDARLKQRVVGAFVLTALAIIILPMLLDGSAEDRDRVMANIPDAPKIEVKKMSIKDLRLQMARMERASAAQLPREVVDENTYETATDFTLDKNNLPVSWSLQLGSFESKENAIKLRTELRDAEYRSYVLHAKTSKGETYRVFIGPMVKKSALQELQGKIETSFKLRGQVVRYRIEDDAGQLGG